MFDKSVSGVITVLSSFVPAVSPPSTTQAHLLPKPVSVRHTPPPSLSSTQSFVKPLTSHRPQSGPVPPSLLSPFTPLASWSCSLCSALIPASFPVLSFQVHLICYVLSLLCVSQVSCGVFFSVDADLAFCVPPISLRTLLYHFLVQFFLFPGFH